MEVPPFEETIKKIDLHVLGDTSKDGVSAVLYAVTYQQSGLNKS